MKLHNEQFLNPACGCLKDLDSSVTNCEHAITIFGELSLCHSQNRRGLIRQTLKYYLFRLSLDCYMKIFCMNTCELHSIDGLV